MENNSELFNELIKIESTSVVMDNGSAGNCDFIPIMPLCNFFGLNYKRLAERVRKDEILKNEWTKLSSELAFGDNRLRFCVTKKGFLRLVQLINANLVSQKLRPKFVQFQANVFDYLYSGASSKVSFLEDMQGLNNKANRLRTERGRLGKQIQAINKTIAQMQEIGHGQWQGIRENMMQQLSEKLGSLT